MHPLPPLISYYSSNIAQHSAFLVTSFCSILGQLYHWPASLVLLVSIAHLSPSAAYHIIIDQLIFSALASIVGNQLACIIVTNHQQKAA
jgi:hypothetical protein